MQEYIDESIHQYYIFNMIRKVFISNQFCAFKFSLHQIILQ